MPINIDDLRKTFNENTKLYEAQHNHINGSLNHIELKLKNKKHEIPKSYRSVCDDQNKIENVSDMMLIHDAQLQLTYKLTIALRNNQKKNREIEDLKKQLKIMKSKNERDEEKVDDIIEKLEEENDLLKMTANERYIEGVKSSKKIYEEEIKKLKDENKKIKDENENHLSSLVDINKEYEELKHKYVHLDCIIQDENIENGKFRDKYEKLKIEYEKLKIENEKLNTWVQNLREYENKFNTMKQLFQ